MFAFSLFKTMHSEAFFLSIACDRRVLLQSRQETFARNFLFFPAQEAGMEKDLDLRLVNLKYNKKKDENDVKDARHNFRAIQSLSDA